MARRNAKSESQKSEIDEELNTVEDYLMKLSERQIKFGLRLEDMKEAFTLTIGRVRSRLLRFLLFDVDSELHSKTMSKIKKRLNMDKEESTVSSQEESQTTRQITSEIKALIDLPKVDTEVAEENLDELRTRLDALSSNETFLPLREIVLSDIDARRALRILVRLRASALAVTATLKRLLLMSRFQITEEVIKCIESEGMNIELVDELEIEYEDCDGTKMSLILDCSHVKGESGDDKRLEAKSIIEGKFAELEEEFKEFGVNIEILVKSIDDYDDWENPEEIPPTLFVEIEVSFDD